MKIAAVLALATFAVASSDDKCSRDCSFIKAPVCGYDPKTKNFKTFDNSCYLGLENCLQKTSYYKRFVGPCVQPRTTEAAAAQPENQNQDESNENNCKIVCPEIYGPVCGYDPKTNQYKQFPNICELRNENCLQKTNYYKKSFGRCISPRESVAQSEDENNDECPLFCPLISLPVCGYDEKTGNSKIFDSPCDLKFTNCWGGTNYVEKSDAACSDDE